MPITKKTILDQIEITRDGVVQIRLAKIIEEDGVELAKEYHRTSVEPGGDVDAQMAAVNAHLVAMKQAPLEASALGYLKPIANAAHTADKVRKFREKRDAELAKLDGKKVR